MVDATDMIDTGVRRKDPAQNLKDVGVFKTSKMSGDVGVIDLGDRSKTYTIDLNEINALTVLDLRENADVKAIASLGQDGKRFQNKEIGLIDNESGEVDAELIALITSAADTSITSIELVAAGDGFVEIAVAGDWSTDILRFEGNQLNAVLADLSDMPDMCEMLPKGVDLKDSKSDIGVFDYDKSASEFSGDDGHVASSFVRQEILSGSRLTLDEATDLINYALSADGQADDDISIDFNGEAFIVELNINNRGAVDTLVLKGDALFANLGTTFFQGRPIVDVKNKSDQFAFFDYSPEGEQSFFVGSGADVSAEYREVVGGSRLEEDEALELVALTDEASDPGVQGVTYLAGDDDSAIIQIDNGRAVDTLILDFG